MKQANPRKRPRGLLVDEREQQLVRAALGQTRTSRRFLIEALHLLQDGHGALTPGRLAALARHMHLSQAEVYETASFYAHFQLAEEDAPGPIIRVCTGVACRKKGPPLLDELRERLGEKATVVAGPCMGTCDRPPAVLLGRNPLGATSGEEVSRLFEDRAFTGDATARTPFKAYKASGGYDIYDACLSGTYQREAVIETVESSGLRGLGGAGFPAGRKWRFMAGKPKRRVLVVNADEGEPGTFKDRYCLETDPHRVIEGALIAAWAVDAEDIYIYLRDEYPHLHRQLGVELDRLAEAYPASKTKIHLRRGAGAYICGEETALIESLEGKRGLPRIRPPFPAEAGLFGRPTLVHNVETLYRLRDILGHGAEAYRRVGCPRFFSVSGAVAKPGVKEAPAGISLNDLIERHCDGMASGRRLKAFLPGGASGGLFPATMADQPLEVGTFEPHGGFLGSAAIVVFSQDDDIREIVLNLLRFMVHESCGQCTPCRLGCGRLVEMAETSKPDPELLNDLAGVMRDGSICGLGQAAPNALVTALRYFPEAFT